MIDIKSVLEKHTKWLRDEEGGERADLSAANLYRADLHWADLREADLRGANLSAADLYRADLYRADLRGADLRGANLREANLYGADLRGADLLGANLREANLYEADLRGANLLGANLREANLYEADLRGANLSGANLYEVVNIFYPINCPESGSFIGWKKARDNKIVKLEIADDAKRSSATFRKCRCSKAKVISIENAYGSIVNEAISTYDDKFIYRVGETVQVDNFDDDRWNECSRGIHFFITREEAVRY